MFVKSDMKEKGKIKWREKAALLFTDDVFDGWLSEELIELSIIPTKLR